MSKGYITLFVIPANIGQLREKDDWEFGTIPQYNFWGSVVLNKNYQNL